MKLCHVVLTRLSTLCSISIGASQVANIKHHFCVMSCLLLVARRLQPAIQPTIIWCLMLSGTKSAYFRPVFTCIKIQQEWNVELVSPPRPCYLLLTFLVPMWGFKTFPPFIEHFSLLCETDLQPYTSPTPLPLAGKCYFSAPPHACHLVLPTPDGKRVIS